MEILKVIHSLVNPEDDVSSFHIAGLVQPPSEVYLLDMERLWWEEVIDKVFLH